ncbi:retrotransposon unclassified [Hordeum vulgare]|nr:retrotransposon unclassified [Hordeum vulgare]
MKVTLWRFAHDCLPCGHQLQKRKIPARTSCIFCNQHETIEHSLLFYQFADKVWTQVKADFPVQLRRSVFFSPRTWAMDFLSRCSNIEATTVMVTMWHIWDARNSAREGGALVHPSAVALKVKAYLNMILLHLYNNDSVQRCVSSSSHKWIPPPEGTVLVNVDAAVFAPTRHMGAGVVIRDHLGSFLAASRELFQEVTNPELAEARAVLHAIVFARAEGFSKVIISSDCASMI